MAFVAVAPDKYAGKFFFIASALGFCAHVFAAEVHCPKTLNAYGDAFSLDDASVFDGPPEELGELMPDLETSEWDIATEQAVGKEQGRRMYLVCRYRGSKRTVKLQIPRDAKHCKVEGTARGTTSAWCKPTVPRQAKQNKRGDHGHQS